METRPRNQGNRTAAAIGGLLIVFGVLSLLGNFILDLTGLMWAAALAAGAVVVYGIYLSDRSQWWLQIPAYVLLALAGLIGLTVLNILQDEWIASYVLFAIGLPFLYVYARHPRDWWPLIPAYTMAAIGTMVALISLGILNDLLIPAYVNLAIALPFLFVYLRNRRNWWALIPGGIMAAIGLSFLAGAGAFNLLVPAILIAGGVFLLARQFLGGAAPSAPATEPMTGPAADKAPETDKEREK